MRGLITAAHGTRGRLSPVRRRSRSPARRSRDRRSATTSSKSSSCSSCRRAISSRSSISPLDLGRPRAQPALELLERRRDEDRDRARRAPRLTSSAPFDLELEHRRRALGRDAVDLRAQRPVARGPTNSTCSRKLAGGDAARELLVAQEPVLDAVLLARPLLARRRRDGELELREAREQRTDERALPGSGWPGDDEDGPARQVRPSG